MIVLWFLFLSYNGSGSMDANLNSWREELKVPAVTVAVVDQDKLLYTGTVGHRSVKDHGNVSSDALFHYGSCTKAMTSTMIAVLVEKGILSWDLTIGEVFPQLKGKVIEGYLAVRLDQLLSHRAGIAACSDIEPTIKVIPEDIKILNGLKGTGPEQRIALLEPILSLTPLCEVGQAFHYSNAGYAIAAAMAERKTGKPWVELMRLYLFDPLNLNSICLGWPSAKGGQAWPVGHFQKNGILEPVDDYFVAESLTPAGLVSGTSKDLALFCQLYLRALRDEKTAILKKATFKKLYHPNLDDYAMGWVCGKDEKDNLLLWHNGSVGVFYSLMMVLPEKNRAFVIMINMCDEEGKEQEIAMTFLRRLAKHFK